MIYKKNLFGEVKEMKIDINDIYIINDKRRILSK